MSRGPIDYCDGRIDWRSAPEPRRVRVARDLYAQGMTLRQVGAQMGYSSTTIGNWIRGRAYTGGRLAAKQARAAERHRRMAELLQQGISLRATARSLGVSDSQAKRDLARIRESVAA